MEATAGVSVCVWVCMSVCACICVCGFGVWLVCMCVHRYIQDIYWCIYWCVCVCIDIMLHLCWWMNVCKCTCMYASVHSMHASIYVLCTHVSLYEVSHMWPWRFRACDVARSQMYRDSHVCVHMRRHCRCVGRSRRVRSCWHVMCRSHEYTHKQTHMCVSVCVCVCVTWIYVQTNTHTYDDTFPYMYTHTHAHMWRGSHMYLHMCEHGRRLWWN